MVEHFHPMGALPSPVSGQAAQRQGLPVDNDRTSPRRGFLVAPGYRQILAQAGHVGLDIGAYDFLLSGEQFDSNHPSLQLR